MSPEAGGVLFFVLGAVLSTLILIYFKLSAILRYLEESK